MPTTHQSWRLVTATTSIASSLLAEAVFDFLRLWLTKQGASGCSVRVVERDEFGFLGFLFRHRTRAAKIFTSVCSRNGWALCLGLCQMRLLFLGVGAERRTGSGRCGRSSLEKEEKVRQSRKYVVHGERAVHKARTTEDGVWCILSVYLVGTPYLVSCILIVHHARHRTTAMAVCTPMPSGGCDSSSIADGEPMASNLDLVGCQTCRCSLWREP